MKVTREFNGRMSSDRRDPGHLAFCQHISAKVYLDGVELKYCTMVDTVKGEITKYRSDADGRPIMAEQFDDELASEHLTGMIGRLRVTYEEEVPAPLRDIIGM